MVSGPIAPSSPGMGYLTTLSVPPRAPHPAAFAGSRAVDRRINRPSKTNAAPRGVNPVPVPAREMEGSVREFMLNCNGWEADCLYPLNRLRMNLLAELVPGLRTGSLD